jgi:hypothetical protein
VADGGQGNLLSYSTRQPTGERQSFNGILDMGPNHKHPHANSASQTNQIFSHSSTSQIGPLNQQPTQFNLNSIPILQSTNSPHLIKPADTKNNTLTHLYSPSFSNNDLPIILSQAITEPIIDQLMPNNSLIFNSQPNTQTPQKLLPTNHKASRGPHKQNPVTRPSKINRPEPSNTQSRPDKKSKPSKPTHDPKQNPIPGDLMLNVTQNLEVQGEKKRRREDEAATVDKNSEGADSFLMAGPGSQDCRDQ